MAKIRGIKINETIPNVVNPKIKENMISKRNPIKIT